jgi:thiol-disulfide isomerase/thioredoxin
MPNIPTRQPLRIVLVTLLALGSAALWPGHAARASDDCQLSKTTEAMPPLAVGEALPTFGGYNTAGRMITGSSLLSPPAKQPAPDVLVLSFWATWCPPCVRSLPLLQKVVSKDRPGTRVSTMLVAVKDKMSGTDLDTFLADLGVSLPSIEDPHGVIGGRLGVTTKLPRTVVVDGKGIVRTIFISECEGDFAEKLDAAIEAAGD